MAPVKAFERCEEKLKEYTEDKKLPANQNPNVMLTDVLRGSFVFPNSNMTCEFIKHVRKTLETHPHLKLFKVKNMWEHGSSK